MDEYKTKNLPNYLRSSGRINDLHEFQQRVRLYSTRSVQEEENVDEENHHLTVHQDECRPIEGPVIGRLKKRHHHHRFSKVVFLQYTYLIIFFLLMGICGALLNLGLRRLFRLLLSSRLLLIKTVTSPFLQCFLWTLWVCSFLALSIYVTSFSSIAAGSGIPQMKSILTGIDPTLYLPGYFTIQTFMIKAFGLILSIGGGLILGTEGTFIHLTSILTLKLCRLHRCFRTYLQSRAQFIEIMTVSCAVAVAMNFLAPLGSLLFSIEVTSTYYMISNYWKSFVGITVAVLVSMFMSHYMENQNREIVLERFNLEHTPFFLILGLMMGLVAAGLCWLVARISRLTSDETFSKYPMIRYLFPALTAIATGILTFYPLKFCDILLMDEAYDLFHQTIQSSLKLKTGPAFPSPWWSLLGGFVLSFLLSLNFNLKSPSGAWIPAFVAGSYFGYSYGSLIRYLLPNHAAPPHIYAAIGAASMAGALTKTVSSAILTIEITSQYGHLIPTTSSVFVAIGIYSLFQSSIYDMVVSMKNLPFLPFLQLGEKYEAQDFIGSDLVYLTKETTLMQLVLTVNRMGGNQIPVVESDTNKLLLGTISSSDVKKVIRACYDDLNLGSPVDDIVDMDDDPQTKGLQRKRTWIDTPDHSMRDRISWNTLRIYLNDEKLLSNNRYTMDRIYSSSTPYILSNTCGSDAHTINNARDATIDSTFTNRKRGLLSDNHRLQRYLSNDWKEDKKQLLISTKVTLGPNKVDERLSCTLHSIPMTLSYNASIHDVHILFTMLRCDHCYVTKQGKLHGVITTKSIIEAGKELCESM